MQNCCITCCDSSKFTNSRSITYFTFPVHNEPLMTEWLRETGCKSLKNDLMICSLHFLPEDIVYNPRKGPVLKKSAVPRLYLRESIQSAISKNSSIRFPGILRNHKNKDFKSVPVPNSLTLTPGIIHQLPKDAVLSVPYVSPRFRKILPKLEPIRNKNLNSGVQGHSPQNPYIIIIPRIDAVPNNTRLSNLSKRKAILRITINKEYNMEDFDVRECQSDEDRGDSEEIEIKNYKTNRAVVFSLDPITGEILVTKRDIEGSKTLGETPINEKQRNQLKNTLSSEKVEELKDLCIKAEQDRTLVKQRLENLYQKQKDESLEFEKLQAQLASLHAESPVESQNKGEKRKTEEKSSQVQKKLALNVENSKSEETLISAADISISKNGWPNSFSILKHSIKENDSIKEKKFGSLSDTSVALHASFTLDQNESY